MHLRLTGYPRQAQNCLVMTTSVGTFKLTAVGDVIDVPDQAGYEILAKYASCVEVVREATSKRKGKMMASPENKMVSKAVEDML